MDTRRAQLELGWPLVLSLAAIHFCAFADRAVPAAFAPALRESFRLSDAQLGALQGTVFILPYALATLIGAAALARFHPLRIVAASMVAWTAACGTFALASNLSQLLLARAALGTGQALLAPAALAVLSSATRPAATIAVSTFTAGSSSGRSGGLIAGGLLLALVTRLMSPPHAQDAWRIASLWLLLPNILLAGFLFRASGASTGLLPDSSTGGMRDAIAGMMKEPRVFGGHLLASCAVITIVQSGGAWAPSILHRTFALSPSMAALLFGVIVLACAPVGHLAAGRHIARAGHWSAPASLMIGGSVLASTCCLLLTWAGSATGAAIGLCGLTVGGGAAAAAAMIGFQQLTTPDVRLPASAVYMTAVGLAGYGVGPLLTGALSDVIGPSQNGLAQALLLTTGLSSMIVMSGVTLASGRWQRVRSQAQAGVRDEPAAA